MSNVLNQLHRGVPGNRPRHWLLLLLVLASLGLVGCPRQTRTGGPATASTRSFTSQNFFSLSYPSDWVARDMVDGANLFFAEELIFVRVKLYEPPDPQNIDAFMDSRIRADADMQGGQATLLRSGNKGNNPYSFYLITKPNGQRLQEILFYNKDLVMLYVISGSSRPEDFDEFSKIFTNIFDSFQFQVSARVPKEDNQPFQPDYSVMSGTWSAYLEGLRTENYSLLEGSCARVNGSKLIQDVNVRKVKADYFPYGNPVYTFISRVEIRDRLALVNISVRSLPPEGFLRHETREFIKEDDHWRILRFERTE